MAKKEEKWRKLTFCVFDAPGKDLPYEERISFLKSLTLPQHVNVVEPIKCEGPDHLKGYLSQVLSSGGEGVMLRQPNSLYTSGRSKSLQRVKVYSINQ